MKFLIIGLGSMGKRRIRNLQHLKAGEIIAFELKEDRRKEVEKEYGIKTVASFEEGMAENPDALIISTPPKFHMQYVLKSLEAGKPCFVEASVLIEDGFDDAIRISKDKNILVAPSCTLRFHPLVKKIKEVVDSGQIGKIAAVRYHMGQWLPDWHPWEDISKFYVGKKETGACREMVPFELEWMQWIFGPVEKVSCMKGKQSSLKADIDDVYQILTKFKSGPLGSILIDVVSRNALRFFVVVGDEGTIEWDWNKEEVRLFTASDKKWKTFKEEPGIRVGDYIAKENMYIDEMEHFIKAVKGEEEYMYSLGEDKRNLELLLAAEKSSDEGKQVDLNE